MNQVKTTQRRSVEVVRLDIEVNHALYQRLCRYVDMYQMTKRDIVSEALLIWLNSQDVQRREVV